MKIKGMNDVKEEKKDEKKGGMSSILDKIYDASCLKEFFHCKRRFYEGHLRLGTGVEPLGTNVALDFGGVLHEVMKVWYETKDIEEALKKWDTLALSDDVRRTKEHGEAWMRAYVLKYEKDFFTVRAVETEYFLDMPEGRTASGRIDLILEEGPLIQGMDHKTASSMGKNLINLAHPSVQFRGYSYAIRELIGRCDGFIVNGISTAKNPGERFQRVPVVFTDKELDSYVRDFTSWGRDIERRVKEGDWPCEDHDCGKYSGCPYEDICIHGWNDNLLGIHFKQKEPNINEEEAREDVALKNAAEEKEVEDVKDVHDDYEV